MRKSILIGIGSLALTSAAGCSGGGGGGEKADSEVIVGIVSGPTTEGGEQATFSVVLRARPSRDVVVPVASTNELEGTVAPASVTFTRENWDAPQSVLVTGIDDVQKDGNATYVIALGQPVSDDESYALLDPDDVFVTNLDDETAGVRVSNVSGPVTELGTQATFTIALQSRPTADVLTVFGTSDLSEGTTDIQQATFTPDNWDAPQTVTITGLDDGEADSTQNFAILFASAFSEDPEYAFLPIDAVPVTNLDDDSAGILLDKNSGITSELLDQETFSVRLLSRPSATVTLTWTLSSTAEASFSNTTAATITQVFTVNNWDALQSFIVRGDNDSAADGDKPYTVSVTSVTSTDAAYVAVTRPVINLVNVDNDIAGFIVTPPSGPTSEAGSIATFTVALRAASTGAVNVDLGTTLPKEATVSPASLSLTTTPATVTITGKGDFKRDGHKPFGVTFTPAVSTDPSYSGRQIPNVGTTNIDNGPVKRLLILDDANGTHADEAADDAGYEVVLVNDAAAFDLAFDTTDISVIILELSSSLLPVSTETRLVAWASSNNQLVLSHWDLASHPGLQSALEVSAVSFASNNRLMLPATGVQRNLFLAPSDFPSPLIGDAIAGDFGNTLMATTTAGILAVRFDDATTGPGAIVQTRNGSAFVNGFSADDLVLVDAEPGAIPGDGIPDLRELYINELAALTSGDPVAGGRADNNTTLAIPDSNPTGATSNMNVTVLGPVNKVRLLFHITHTFDADLDIQLRGPDGTIIDVSSDNGSSNNDYGTACAPDAARTTFDDAAATAITAGTAPFAGSFRPETALTAFTGKTAAGTWSLVMVDDLGGDVGTLQCWSLIFE